MREQLQALIQQEAEDKLRLSPRDDLVKVIADGKILQVINDQIVQYMINWKYIRRSKGQLYVEERQEERQAYFDDGELQMGSILGDEKKKNEQNDLADFDDSFFQEADEEDRAPFYYDRQKAVQYAETWWNAYNPRFPKFNDDCTNYISQCLFSGGFPAVHSKQRNKGWWYKSGSYSYSWAVAHALAMFLTTSNRTKVVTSAESLTLGDIICYDFEGDGRFNHNTMVTGKDVNGFPLVNAHSMNSRQRFWNYHDSSAYTPNIRYRFVHIL